MAIQVENLTKRYGRQLAVDALTFQVDKGEILGFLGPNGAGKSTTMKIMSSYLLPDSGEVSLEEYKLHAHPLEIRKRIGYLPEHNPLYLDMYVKEFLIWIGRIHRLHRRRIPERVEEVIQLTGLTQEQHKRIGQLSKGYRQRVGLAQAIIHDPDVLILDEPTTGLDPNQIVDIRNLIRKLGRTKSIIFSSHILSEVEAIADRIIIIHQGKMVAHESVPTLREQVQQEVKVSVEFAEPGFDWSQLAEKSAVKHIDVLSDTQFEILTHKTLDIRPELFQECVAQKNTLLTVYREVYTLEETFRNLTQGSKENSYSD